MNPLLRLSPVFEVLAHNVEVLPAMGHAMEDLVRPDEDEELDRKLNQDVRVVDTLFETPDCEWYHNVPPISRLQKHLFRYFLDGSRRSYFLGTAIEGEHATPIQLAQIGAAVVRRDASGKMRAASTRSQLLLLLSKKQLSDDVWSQLEKVVAGIPDLTLEDISRDDPINGTPAANVDLRNRGGGKTNWAMHRMEVALANDLKDRGPNDWLIVDGSLSFEPAITVPRTIGVAKSFNKELEFQLHRCGRREKKSLFHLFSDLKAEQRTAVWAMKGGKVAFWYLRLREQGTMDYPLMGVIKVEIRPTSGDALDSALVDDISRCLVAERHVTPYGRDSRWHVHLYPIFLTEQVIKNNMISGDVLRNGIRWPFPTA